MIGALLLAATVTVNPVNTDEVLVNPDMGLVMFMNSNRPWAYGSQLELGDTLDWFPGTSAVYFRLPWSFLEPKEGEYRWDLIDSYAAAWIAAGKQLAFRFTCCESRYRFATPQWVKDAGAKGWWWKKGVPGELKGEVDLTDESVLWEPDYGDPVFLEKLENFLAAFARRYEGKDYVAFLDVGTIGLWGEGHTPVFHLAYGREKRDANAVVRQHYALHRRLFPKTTLLCIDDQAGSEDQTPDHPLMKAARDLGIGFRDDSILVYGKKEKPGYRHPQWFHAGWARLFAPTLPVFVEHEHYSLSVDRGAWSDDLLVESVEDYRASWLSIHGWPDEIKAKSGEAFRKAALRAGYRFELRSVTYPDTVKPGEPVEIASTWVNVGVARRYKGAFAAWSLVDAKGRVAWVSADDRHDFREAEPKLDGVERPFSVVSRVIFGTSGVISRFNDGVLDLELAQDTKRIPADFALPVPAPGEYTLCVSLGTEDGVPKLALPLKDGKGRRYPVGRIRILHSKSSQNSLPCGCDL